ncbi:MAG TPA: hypothetical protein VFT50_07120 [Baekduia sp.]|nr:hypothetical protein [Baekduia sp.]
MSLGWARVGIVAAVVVAAAGASGCSTGVDAGDESHARSAARVFLDLCAEGHGSDLSHLLNGPALETMLDAGDLTDGCAAVLRLSDRVPAAAFAAAQVTDVKTNGGEAEITVDVPGATAPGSLEAEREGDRWELTNSAFGG